MIPRPQTVEVNRLASQAIDLRENEGISMLEAIETVCHQALVPTADKPLTIGNVHAYLHLLQDAVTDEVYAQKYHAADPAVIEASKIEAWKVEEKQLEAEGCGDASETAWERVHGF